MEQHTASVNWMHHSNGMMTLSPCWDVPSHVKTMVTTRIGGNSRAPYNGLNLAMHVGDDLNQVMQNRKKLQDLVPHEPIWLNQVHGKNVWTPSHEILDADSAVTSNHQVLAMMTADCLPVLFCDQDGEIIAACHAGWRGLAMGVIEASLAEMIHQRQPDNPKDYLRGVKVYLGPAIGPTHFEVGEDVIQAFQSSIPSELCNQAFKKISETPKKFLANLFSLAMIRLGLSGVNQVSSEFLCAYEHHENFFSHRRDGVSGRFGTFIWKSME